MVSYQKKIRSSQPFGNISPSGAPTLFFSAFPIPYTSKLYFYKKETIQKTQVQKMIICEKRSARISMLKVLYSISL